MAEELPLAAGYRYPPSARHTCCHCETIIIDPASADADVLPPDEFRNSFRFSMEAAFQAYRDGCLVFRRIILDTIYTRRDIFKSCLRSQLLSSFPRREASIPLLRITIDVLGAGISEARSKYCWVDDDNVSMSGDTRYAGHYMIDCEHGMSQETPNFGVYQRNLLTTSRIATFIEDQNILASNHEKSLTLFGGAE